MRLSFLSAALAALAVCASPALGQPLPPSIADTGPLVGVQPQAVTPLPPPIDQRVSDLERENVQLKARVLALEKLKAGPSPATAGETADRWVHPQFPGVVFTKTQLSAMYPGIAFNTPAAPGVARTTAPFDSCPDNCPVAGCVAGCSTTPTTPAIAAGTPGTTLTYGLVPSARGGTNTGAGCVATSGGTSGCSAAGCSAGFVSNRGGWYPGKLLGR